MKKITQNLTKSLWRSGLIAMTFLFSLTINLSAQETVLAVWDFNEGSTEGAFLEGITFDEGANLALGWLKNGDQTGVSDPNSVVASGRNGYSGGFLGGSNLTPAQLVDGKLHISITLNNIDLTAGADGTAAAFKFFLKGVGNPAYNENHRMAGVYIDPDEADLKVRSLVFNNGIQTGGAKDVGGLGTSSVYSDQITLGTTMDFINYTSSFWVGSPGENPDTPFGLTMATNAVNQSTAWNDATQTMSVDAVIKLLQFQMVNGSGSIETDQFKISTGTYENTAAAGDETAVTDGCDLSINMIDSYGDSWNGGQLVVSVNGVEQGTYANTADAGAGEAQTVALSTSYGDVVTFDFTCGSYCSETSFNVTDADGNIVASGGGADSADATYECLDPDAVNLGVSVTTGVASATFSFDIANFIIDPQGSALADGHGHIHWSIFASSDLENPVYSDMIYSADDATLNDLPDGDHTVVFSLVDNEHNALDPAVEAIVEFSTFDESYDCGDTQSYTYENGSGGGSGFDTNFTGANEDELAFTVTPAAGENVTLVIGGETENNWDWIYVTDEAGAVVYGPATGPQDVTVTTTGAANVYVSADGSITKTLTFAITCEEAVDPTYALTFNLNTANIEVGENGMFVGGGFVDSILGGGANALPMTDEDGDGIWTATMQVPEGTSGNYTYINSTGNYDGKEDISGQECADADNWNDRVLDGPITEDTTLNHCYGFCGDSCPAESNLEFKGVIDFSVNQGAVNSDLFGGSDGKAVHVIATADIADMSIYSIVLYANGSTDPYNSFDFPAISASAGDEILVARNVDAQNYYMDASSFYTTIIDGDGWPTSNGNDALELYSGTEVIDVFGVVGDNPDTTGNGCATEDCWDHEDAWAYKADGVWTYGDVNCTDGTETICESSCVYPFVETLCITTGIEPGCSDFEGDDGAAGWTIVEAAGNTSDWMLDTTPGAEDTQSMGHGYTPADVAYNDWIVSPGYNTTGLAEPTLTYEEYLNWSGDAGEHNVYYSVDYDGDATTATWVLLNSEIGVDAEDVFTSRSFALPSDYNVVVGFQYLATYGADWNIDNVCIGEAPNEQINVYADPANAWGGYMDVFFLNDDGSQGDYAFGSPWDIADLQTTFNVGDASNIVLEPNFNAYNADDAYWSDGNGNGNKFMNATTQVESWDMYNGADLTFSGTVADNNLADGYEAVYFIKCLDPDAGYSDILAGAYVMSLPTSGEFSVSVSGDLLPEGKLVQFGFQVRGINANPDAGPYGRAVIGDAGLSVSDNTLLDMRIYPNPSNGSYVTIQTPVNGVKYVEVFDITGKRLMNTSLSADTLDVSSISAGLYLVKVTVEGQSKTSKLIIR